MKWFVLCIVCIAVHCSDAAVIRAGLLRVSTNSTGPGRYGSPGCPCVGVDELDGETIATLKGNKKASYPADLGARCEDWDNEDHPSCKEGGKSWCKSKWCYVDPCNCKDIAVLPKPSNYLPGAKFHGRPVHFSYATCGGSDSYSAEEAKKTAKDIEATCAVKVDPAKWGKEGCRCVGIGPQPGTTKVNIKGKQVDFPADTGATCQAWESGNHPECNGDDAPDWCTQKWCYVDPCSCGLPTPPKTSSYLPDSNFQGKPVYYSYATCGGSDSYTAGRKEACVNQKTEDDCGKLDKCAWWSEKGCLGKELVMLCRGHHEAKPTIAHKAPAAKKFIASVQFKHRLRVCNAYPNEDPLDVYRGAEKLTKLPLEYQMCGDFTTPMLSGDQFKFLVGGARAGVFTISDLPNNDAVLLLIMHRHDTLSTAVSFHSHVFANLLNAQIAVIDTYKGRQRGQVEITDGGKKAEKLRYNSVVAVNPGEYKVTLDGDEKRKASVDFTALNRESYVIIRTGVESQGGPSFAQDLMVYPISDPTLLHAGSSRMTLGAVFALALLTICRL